MSYLPYITHRISSNTSGTTANIFSGSYVLAGGNNITLSQNANSVTIVGGGGGAAGTNTFGMSNLGNTSGTSGTISGSNVQFVWAGGNNVTLSQSLNGSSGTITISAFNQSNQAFSAQGGSSAFQTLVFTNSNGISFSNTNGSIWGSHNGITSQTNQSLGAYAVSNTTQGTSGTIDARSLSFNGAGNISAGISNGSVVISGVDNFNIVRAGTTGTIGSTWSSSNATVQINGSSGILVSQDNSNNINILGAGIISHFEPYPLVTGSAVSSHAPASWWFNRFTVPSVVTLTGIHCPVSFNASVPGATSQASTGTARYSYSKGITLFSRQDFGANSSNMSQIATASFGLTAGLSYSSTSQSFVFSWVTNSTGGTSSFNTTSNAGGWSLFITGMKQVVIPMVRSLTAGEYFIAHNHSSTTGTTQSNLTLLSASQFHIAPQLGGMGIFGNSNNALSAIVGVGEGVASAVTTNNTMAFSNVSSATRHLHYFRMLGS